MIGPAIGCSTTRSILAETVSGSGGWITWVFTSRSASRIETRMSWVLGTAQLDGCGASRPASSIGSTADHSSSSPPRRTAVAGITGMPSSSLSATWSICNPRWRAMSIMLRIITIGRPIFLSSETRRSAPRRLVASPTARIMSGTRSPGRWPSSTSRVTSSSGERARRLCVPGRSISANLRPAGVVATPTLRSTVTPE